MTSQTVDTPDTLSSAEPQRFFFSGGENPLNERSAQAGLCEGRLIHLALCLHSPHTAAFFNKRFELLQRREPQTNLLLSCYAQVTVDDGTVVIVDEVGKMELFSPSFISSVHELFSLQQATILATVPLTKQRPISFVDELKNRKDVTLIEVRCLYIDYFHSTINGTF